MKTTSKNDVGDYNVKKIITTPIDQYSGDPLAPLPISSSLVQLEDGLSLERSRFEC